MSADIERPWEDVAKALADVNELVMEELARQNVPHTNLDIASLIVENLGTNPQFRSAMMIVFASCGLIPDMETFNAFINGLTGHDPDSWPNQIFPSPEGRA